MARSTSPFRAVAFGISAVAAMLFVLVSAFVFQLGDRTRVFGWTAPLGRLGPVVSAVAKDGPAAGFLQPGDLLVAIDGDTRIGRLGFPPFRRFLRPGATYRLTARRDGVDRDVTLTVVEGRDADQMRLAESLLFDALAWIVVSTLIAAYRPEQTVSRSAYFAGIIMGAFMVNQAQGAVQASLAEPWRTASLFVFPFGPLHLAVGYDFYVRFPPAVTTTRVWRAIRNGLYVVCGVLCVWTSLLDRALMLAGKNTFLGALSRLAPIDRWVGWVDLFIYPAAGLAIVAVVARNYRAVESQDDRRRLRWVVWGTVVGLIPFLIVELTRSIVVRLMGIPVDYGRWWIVANVMTAAIPLSFGYAIIKHRVFDITFVVRRGLQYLLAKNALRALLLLPLAGLAYGVVAHRDQPVGGLLLTNSVYVYLIAAAVISLRFRTQLSGWLDRRFFREAYDRERILLELIDDVEQLESASSVSKLVSHELEAAFHPRSLFVWYREPEKPTLTLSYSSGGFIHSSELGPGSPLVKLGERESGVVTLPLANPDDLPPADRQWLEDTGVRLIVPMVGSDRRLLGLLMLGDKKSEEPYSTDDLKLLQAIARQIAAARETARLKERVDEDRRIRHDVLAHLETGHVNLLKECPTCGACYDAPATACAADGAELKLSLPVERTIDGKYRLDRLIGTGGMGAVYEAADLGLARTVAVKIMLGRAFGDRQALKRFEREAQASARLTHPNIVTVFDFGAVGADGAFLVMELLRGRTLRAELDRRGRLPAPVAASWFEQICAAVAAAHHQQIVHRDLKPENVLVTVSASGADVVKVLDFGLAKMAAADAGQGGGLTNPGVVMGTVGYMAPEQLTAGEVDARSDIFALGVMAAEAVTGRRPFRGRTHSELLLAIMHEPLTLGGEGPELRRLESVLRRAAAKDPASRYASVVELAGDLIPALRALPADSSASGTEYVTTLG